MPVPIIDAPVIGFGERLCHFSCSYPAAPLVQRPTGFSGMDVQKAMMTQSGMTAT